MSGKPLFAPPKASSLKSQQGTALGNDSYWKILIVDDDPDIHTLTKLLIQNFTFEERRLEILSAYSGHEAKTLMQSHNDVALVLLDVIMETDTAGLEVARYIRDELGNHYTRIVLRTGQPGNAPEARVIRDYDIDDYKDKTELTDIKLYTLLYSALRSYRDICILDRSRRGLTKIINSSMDIFQSKSMYQFASAMLQQVTNMLGVDKSALYCSTLGSDNRFKILAATGEMTSLLGHDEFYTLPETVQTGFKDALRTRNSIHREDHFVGYYETTHGSENLLYIKHRGSLSELDRQLLEIYSANVAIGYENLLMQEDIQDTQKELVYILGEAVEERSKETGAHVKRVAHICHLLALKAGLSHEEAELLKLASPLHDVGKVGIPDAILNKPGRHDQDEWRVMQTHALLGQEMLKKSERRILKMGSIIAGQHHERWDGNGYPLGLKGEEIHIAGRICALADVFDALGSKRCYKHPWPIDEIMELIRKERGKHFDPNLVDLFFENIEEFAAIRAMYPDHT